MLIVLYLTVFIIYFWLCWVFIDACESSLVVMHGLPIAVASLVIEHGLSYICFAKCFTPLPIFFLYSSRDTEAVSL